MQLIRERVLMRFSIAPRVKDWEKQLRFWTKQHLAETYRSTNQPHAAQTLIEELVALRKTTTFMTDDVHQLAGGCRVIQACASSKRKF